MGESRFPATVTQRQNAHESSTLRHHGPREAGLCPDRSQSGDDVCVRSHRLQLRPHRQRPAGGGLRRAVSRAAPPVWRGPCDLCGQRHRRGRQDQPEGGRRGRGHRRDHRPLSGRLPRGHVAVGRPAGELRAARDADHGRHHRDDRAAGEEQRRLPGRWTCAVQHPGLFRVRQAVGPDAGRHDRRRPGRCGALQAEPRRLRAVEALQAR